MPAIKDLPGPLTDPALTDLVAVVDDPAGTPATKKATVAALLSLVYPIGSIYISTVSTDPATLLGFGTWAAFGAGRCLVGQDAGQSEFDTLEETGGAKTVTLTAAEMPSHTHVQDLHNHTQNSHNHTQDAHTHTQNSHAHGEQLQGGTTGTTTGTHLMGSAATGGSLRTAGQSTLGVVAVNQNATATNQAATAVNQAATATNQNTGGGGAHANLPPYVVVKMWRRTA